MGTNLENKRLGYEHGFSGLPKDPNKWQGHYKTGWALGTSDRRNKRPKMEDDNQLESAKPHPLLSKWGMSESHEETEEDNA